jgi:hypothetical protein
MAFAWMLACASDAHATTHVGAVQPVTVQPPTGQVTLQSGLPPQSTVACELELASTWQSSAESHVTSHVSPAVHCTWQSSPPGSHVCWHASLAAHTQ